MLNGPPLTIAFLSHLPAGAILRDVQAHYAVGDQWYAWTRWPQATPAEIIDDVRLQRRFAPVLTWRCAEISLSNRLRTPPEHLAHLLEVQRPAMPGRHPIEGADEVVMAQVKVDAVQGAVQVERVVCAQDMGLVVNPDGAKMRFAQPRRCVTNDVEVTAHWIAPVAISAS